MTCNLPAGHFLPIIHRTALALMGKFTQKASWSEMKELTKRRRTPLTICKYFFQSSRYFVLKLQISLHGRRHDSHFLNGNEAKVMSQLLYRNHVDVLSLYNSENHEYRHFKFSGIIVFLSSNQNKLITLLPWQPKKPHMRNSY